MVHPPPYQDVQVRPEAVEVFVAAFEMFPSIGHRYLEKHGLMRQSTGARQFVPLPAWLSTFHAILAEIGPNALYRIGEQIIKNPYLVPDSQDVESALRQIDVAFHQSHRRGGQLMFDQATRTMIEGIGHFMVERLAPGKRALVRCDTPYPCPLEHGIVNGVATQIEPRTVVVHHEPDICRMKGGEQCSYLVTW